MSGGGGSGAGKVDYPGYMKDHHQATLVDYRNHAKYLVDEPDGWIAPWDYSWAAPIPPDGLDGADQFDDAVIDYEDIIAAIESSFADWLEQIEGSIPATTSWASLMSTAADAYDTYIGSSSAISDSAAHFEQSLGLPFARARNRLTSGLAEVNAVNSSAFAIGLALLEVEKAREVADYTANLGRQHELNRAQFLTNAGNQMIQIESIQKQSWAQYVGLYMDFKRISHIARQEYVDKRIQYKFDRGHYELDVWSQAGPLIGASGGSSHIPRGSGTGASKTGSALSGAMSGAMLGAATGNVWGALIGAVIGGAAGYFAA